MPDEEFSVDRAVWTALRSERPMTLDELQMLTGCDASACLTYLNVLIRHQYVSVLGVRRAASGEAIPLFRLTKPTGPDAPYGNADDMFCDPNLEKPNGKRWFRKSMGPLPTMQGHIRLAASRLASPFTRDELAAVIPHDGTATFQRSWSRLVWSGELRQIGDAGDGPIWWELTIRPELLRICDWCREHPGDVDAKALKADGITITKGPMVRLACDMLAAEGYQVTWHQKGRIKYYRVEAPKEQA